MQKRYIDKRKCKKIVYFKGKGWTQRQYKCKTVENMFGTKR